MNPFFHTDFSISDSLKNVLIYETIIVIGGLSAMTGGIVGGVGTFAELLKSSLLGIGGNLFVGATGSTVTLYLDDGNISGDDLIEIIMSGGLQAISGTTLGKLFSNAKTDVDKVGKAILNYFESVYDIGGIGLEALLKIICKDDENQKKSQVLSNCGI